MRQTVSEQVSQPFLDYYRCPDRFGAFSLADELRTEQGYFRFGDGLICYGQCTAGHSSAVPNNGLYDSFRAVAYNHAGVHLPFDLSQIVDNLRLERYAAPPQGNGIRRTIHAGYYFVRPLLGVSVRRELQKLFFWGWDKIPFPHWPVDTTVEQLFERLMLLALESERAEAAPFIWFWPDGASSCVMMTHDVETQVGADFCAKLMDIDAAGGLPASFQVVPEERYPVSGEFLERIRRRGFELNIQDLNHDGRLYRDRAQFLLRAEAINRHARAYGARGFRSAVMYRNPDWFEALDVSYDMSVPNAAHLEPQRGGCCTVFPYFIGKLLELPLTTTQDYSLFHILNDYSIELWKRQIRLIRERHGLISFIVHPDYVVSQRAREVYGELLEYLGQFRKDDHLWCATPGEVDAWWRQRSQMRLMEEGGKWSVQGPGSERARVAFAKRDGNRLIYEIVDAAQGVRSR